MSRFAVAGLFVFVFVACTGGPGPIDTIGGGSSSGGSSSGASSSGGSSSGASSSGGSSSGSTGTGGEIRANEFDQSCTEDSDCIAVFEGAICSQCGCPNAAIARSAATDYSTKRQGAGCPTTDVQCAPCQDTAAICGGDGKCSVSTGATNVPDGG